MKTSSTIILTSLLATSFLSAGPVAKAVVLDNNGNPTKSVVNKAAKVKVADEIIDPSDGIVEKTVKAKAVRGDYRKKRKVRREVR